MTKEEKALIKNIDWEPLEKRISDYLGLAITLKVDIVDGYIKFKSNENIIKHAGVMGRIISKLRVYKFGGGYVNKERIGWFGIHLYWKYIGGGSNSRELCAARYIFKNKQWEFAGE